MTRFAWLQSRTQTYVVTAVVAVVAIAAAVTGVQLSHLYATQVAHCQSGCDLAVNSFLRHDNFLQRTLDILAQVTPALLGIFWGAPLLARELETGTYRLAWTQSVSRSRWLVTKLVVSALTTVAVAGAVTLTITWWYRDIDLVGSNQYALFDRRDIVPVGYALFGFAAGAVLGALIRRTVPAMAAALGTYVVARVTVATWVRPNLFAPVHRTMSLFGAGPDAPVHLGIGRQNGGPLQLFAQGDGPHNSWTQASHLVTASGHSMSSAQLADFLHRYCPDVGNPPPPLGPGKGVARVIGQDAGRECLTQVANTFHLVVTYQPAGRYWAFQAVETGIFAVLALACLAGCYWWITHRSS